MLSRDSLAIDWHIGENIRLCRLRKHLSQFALAETIGVSAEQIQDYESGACRIAANRLLQVAKALDVRIGVFFGAPGSIEDLYRSPPAQMLRN